MSAFFGIELIANDNVGEYFRPSSFTPFVTIQRATLVIKATKSTTTTSTYTSTNGRVVRLKSRMKHEPSRVLATFIVGKTESIALDVEFSESTRFSVSCEEDDEDLISFVVHVTGRIAYNVARDDFMSDEDDESESESDESELSWASATTDEGDSHELDEEGGEREEEENAIAIECLVKPPDHLRISSKEWKYEVDERMRVQREALEKAIDEEMKWRDFDKKTLNWWQETKSAQEGYHVQEKQGRMKKSKTLPDFAWTGEMRQFHVTATLKIPVGLQPPDYSQTSWPEEEQSSRFQTTVEIKTTEQIKKMKRVCSLARHVLDTVASHLRVGITTDELDRICHTVCIQNGAYPSPLNYMGFPKSICTSVNEVVCHGIPDRRKLEPGDLINLDVTVCLNGYHGDLSETFIVGCSQNVKNREKLEENKQLLNDTLSSLEKTISFCRPGKRFREIGELIQNDAVENNRWTSVKNFCGHGIGKLFHCAPNIPHYAPNKAIGIMKKGQTFTIEPMFCVGTRNTKHWKDGWTAVTADGHCSAQYEHTVLITEDSVEVLTKRTNRSVDFFIDN